MKSYQRTGIRDQKVVQNKRFVSKAEIRAQMDKHGMEAKLRPQV